MNHAKQVELLTVCLAHLKEKKPCMGGDEGLIPVNEYVDEALFQRERDILFRRTMNLIGSSSEIASPGDFVTRDVLGMPVLLVRDEDGTAKAFVNICRHRGATLVRNEQGHCKRFVCPYHAWTYKIDGSLASVRYQDGFPSLEMAKTSLVPLPCAEAAGLLWVCPDHRQRDICLGADTLAMADELNALGCGNGVFFARTSRIWNANWKLIVDGGLEAYHFRIAHKDTIASFFGDNVSTYEWLGDHIRSILPRLSLLELEQLPESDWNIRQHTHVLYSAFPNASILLQERHFDLVLMTPLTVDKTRVEIITVANRPALGTFSEKATNFLNANHAFTQKTLAEDFELAEQIQCGLRTGANAFFRFARYESALTEWHRLIHQKVNGTSSASDGTTSTNLLRT